LGCRLDQSGVRRHGQRRSRLGARRHLSDFDALQAGHPDLPLDDPSQAKIEVPDFFATARTGLHLLLPVIVLIWCLMVEELSPGLSTF
jgi:TRAP-type uncharacterized transport system fused permease subunit